MRNDILQNNPLIPAQALDRALQFLDHPKVTNKNVMYICDFSVSDAKDRLHLIDLKTFLSESTKVAHGKNSDKNKDNVPDSFSNTPGSYQSSLGAMVIGKSFKNPKWKFVRLMEGLEKGLNDNVRKREILYHSTKYVDDNTSSASGDTLGCFGVSEKTAAKHMPLIEGCLLYAWDDSLEN